MKPNQPLDNLLSGYQPKPGRGFYQRMANAPWAMGVYSMDQSPRRHGYRLIWQIAVVALVVLIALSVGIPEIRASISAWLGLSVAPSNQMPASAVTLIPVTPTTTQTGMGIIITPAAEFQPTELIDQPTEPVATTTEPSWTVLIPEQLPQGYQIQSEYFDANNQMDAITFTVQRTLPGSTDPALTSTQTITLLQALHNDFVPMQISPDANPEDVQINGQTGVYVVGAWDTEFIPDSQDPNGGQMVSTWRSDLAIQNLYWQAGNVYLVLITGDESISLQDLIAMAATLR